jgi:Kef-type K+ transport system membrane component KefB/voltage-gated potassium channel Kch
VPPQASTIADLGLDGLTFLGAVVLVVPLFKSIKASPVLGFLLAGVLCDQFGLFHDEDNVAKLAELGVLFLLFEQGLELSLDRLRALAKYAFGLGLLQIVASTAVFTAFELPVGNALGTQILTRFLGAAPELVDIRSIDEAIVIGAGLSLSSSAFVLQLLSERGELATPFGRATLGILLMQDIAVVPLLVMLPLYEAAKTGGMPIDADSASILAQLGPQAVKAVLGLGALLVGGRFVLRRVFEVVAGARSPEAFVALCLLTVSGAGLITQKLGFSDTLGAFVAGVLLAETNYRQQIEVDIRPFRGLLLGLFFVTTGTSINVDLLVREWPNVLGLLAGLITLKTAIVSAAGPLVGLSRAESVRTGLLVGQGGEFAFVVFSLANQLGVLPSDLNQLLIIVVVLSMALTPVLAEAGKVAYEAVERWERGSEGGMGALGPGSAAEADGDGDDVLADGITLVAGFGPHGQAVCNMLRARLSLSNREEPAVVGYIAFDMDPRRVKAARKRGFAVMYGDASRPEVIKASGVRRPGAVVVAYSQPERAVLAVKAAREAFGPEVFVLARARDPAHAEHLRAAGATQCCVDALETGVQMGTAVLGALGETEPRTLALAAMLRSSEGDLLADLPALGPGIQHMAGVQAAALVERAFWTGVPQDSD